MGELIQVTEEGAVLAPDNPTIPFCPGDGIGPDIWRATEMVLNDAVHKAYGGKRRIDWLEIPAGEKALAETGEALPQASLEAIRLHRVAIKGPLTTPVAKGIRSVNVALRHALDLYACIRPVRYIPFMPSPVKRPQDVDMVIFRENTEDVYMGLEWPSGSKEAAELITLLEQFSGKKIRPDAAIGIKPMSRWGTRRLVRKAIQHALLNKRDSVTLVHKGNIMKYTEGAFCAWGYELAAEEFGEQTVTEAEVFTTYDGRPPEDKVVIKDRIADAMFQEVLLRPAEYSVLAMPNLNGDYMSDCLAATIGGLGMAPGANVGDGYAVFEATHGTAPKYAGQDKLNPGSLILSGVMMLEYLGWPEAADLIHKGLARTIAAGKVTCDLASQMEGATELSCSGFGKALCEYM
jgi:isocitrate dehydrogenase